MGVPAVGGGVRLNCERRCTCGVRRLLPLCVALAAGVLVVKIVPVDSLTCTTCSKRAAMPAAGSGAAPALAVLPVLPGVQNPVELAPADEAGCCGDAAAGAGAAPRVNGFFGEARLRRTPAGDLRTGLVANSCNGRACPALPKTNCGGDGA